MHKDKHEGSIRTVLFHMSALSPFIKLHSSIDVVICIVSPCNQREGRSPRAQSKITGHFDLSEIACLALTNGGLLFFRFLLNTVEKSHVSRVV